MFDCYIILTFDVKIYNLPLKWLIVKCELLSNHGNTFIQAQMYKISNHQTFYRYSNVQ